MRGSGLPLPQLCEYELENNIFYVHSGLSITRDPHCIPVRGQVRDRGDPYDFQRRKQAGRKEGESE